MVRFLAFSLNPRFVPGEGGNGSFQEWKPSKSASMATTEPGAPAVVFIRVSEASLCGSSGGRASPFGSGGSAIVDVNNGTWQGFAAGFACNW